MLQRGDSVGVFQFESEGMREALKKVRPDEFNDLVALNALYRPGAMRYIDTYARNKRNPDAITYIDERLRSITDSSYGVILYQEQSMQIAKAIAGFSGPEADDLRKAIGKKQRDRMAALKDRFFEGARATGTSEAVINELWAVNEAAADYSFNRSHAACYGLISYRTAWLKANYPAEYMAALISSVMSTKDKVPFFVAQCEDMGIEVLPPDVNQSGHDFKVVEGNIRFGLDAVKGLGYQAVEAIITRARGGRAVHLGLGLLPARGLPGGEQEGERVAREVRRLRLARRHAHGDDGGAAARAGGRAAGAGGRAQRPVVVLRPRRRAANEDAAAHHDPPIMPLPDDRKQLNEWEKETLGLFLSSHPLKEVRPALRAQGGLLARGPRREEGRRVGHRRRDDRRVQADQDEEGRPDDVRHARRPRGAGRAARLQLRLRRERGEGRRGQDRDRSRARRQQGGGGDKLVAQEVEAFEPTRRGGARGGRAGGRRADRAARLTIQVDPGVPESFLEDLREVVGHHKGEHELLLCVGERRLLLGPDWRVSADGACRAELAGLTGASRLVA